MDEKTARLMTRKEWGVRWKGEETVIVYGHEKQAKGLFAHYGMEGEELVSRVVSEWVVEDSLPKQPQESTTHA